MTDSAAALRELHKFLGNFKALLPILENAANIEQQVKAGEARLTALKMEHTEAEGKIEKANAVLVAVNAECEEELQKAEVSAKRIKREADEYAETVKASAEKAGTKMVEEAIAKARTQENAADKYHNEAVELLAEVKELTAKRDALKGEMEKIKRAFA